MWTTLDAMMATAEGAQGGPHGDSNGQGIRILLMYSSGSLISYAWESVTLAVGQAGPGICQNCCAAPYRMFRLNLPMTSPGTDSKQLLKSLPVSAVSSLGRSTKEETVLL